MSIRAVQPISRAGLSPALAAAAAAGDALPNTGRAFLRVKNTYAAVARTVTAVSQLPVGAIRWTTRRWTWPLRPRGLPGAPVRHRGGRARTARDGEAVLAAEAGPRQPRRRRPA